MEAETKKTTTKKRKRTKFKLKKRIVIPLVIMAAILFLGIFMTFHGHFYQSTDDAFIEGHIVSIAPRVSGPVIKLYVKDNQEVKKGDILLEIDPSDYEVNLKEKEAQLEEAKVGLNVVQKTIDESQTRFQSSANDLKSAKSALDYAQKTNRRNFVLNKEGIVSAQEYDRSKNELSSTSAQLNSAFEKQKAADITVQSSKAKKEAQKAGIKRLESEVERARLNLSYTKIYAPQDGKISSRTVEEGNYVQAAQPLMSIVSDDVWVVANYKETQLLKMQEGQEAIIKVDTYPNKKFKGKVDSIQHATGAKASLFPPENAVGSYVKIVQRIPVKIIFAEDYSEYNIAPGMSVVPKVKIR